MKNQKRKLIFSLIVAAITSLCSCGGINNNDSNFDSSESIESSIVRPEGKCLISIDPVLIDGTSENLCSFTGDGFHDPNSLINISVTPNKGYSFVGWFNKKTGELLSEDEKFSYMLWEDDVVIEARFKTNSYRFMVFPNKKEKGQVLLRSKDQQNFYDEIDEQIKYSSSVTVVAKSLDANTRFLGWYDSKNKLVSENQIYTFTMPASNYELEGRWNYFTIDYDFAGGRDFAMNPTSYGIEDTVALVEPQRTGYIFTGWSGTGLSGIAKEVVIPSGEMIDRFFTAHWEGEKYTVYLDANGGNSPSNSVVVTYDEGYSLPEPAREGYMFDGWYDGSSRADSSGVWKYNYDREYSAHWYPITYSINYELNEGFISGNPSSYTVENNVTLINPTRNGYTFVGWTGTDLSEPTMNVSFSNKTGDRFYTANWSANAYTIIFNPNGGIISDTFLSVVYGGSYELPQPTREGYCFVGWYDNSIKIESTGTWYDATNMNLTAKWTPISYSINYNLNGGTVSGNPTSYTIEDKISLNCPTRPGYIFDGWTGTDLEEKVTHVSFSGKTGNRSYAANWLTQVYSITYCLNGGSVSGNPTKYTIEDNVTINNPKKRGHSFLGWTGTGLDNPTCDVCFVGETGNKTYTALWSVSSYTVSFDANGGTVSQESIQVDYYSSYTLPTPERKGYSFVGWYSGDEHIETQGTWIYDSGKTLIAKWRAIGPIEKGTYPQSKVTDEELISSLNELAGDLPSEGTASHGNWESYNYYASGSIAHYTWYTDLTHTDGNKYRGVYFTSYRPFFTTDAINSSTRQKSSGYLVNTVYWFKFEPIVWFVHAVSDDYSEALVLPDKILDAQHFYHEANSNSRDINSIDPVVGNAEQCTNVYCSNYKYSDIRIFANQTFYNSAFSEEEKETIITKTISDYNSETQDKIFLLSRHDVTGESYGLASTNSWKRQKISTDYAQCLGCRLIFYSDSPMGRASNWLLRTTGGDSYVGCVDYYGCADGRVQCNCTDYGFFPASWFAV